MQFKHWIKSGAIIPVLVLPVIGLAVLGTVGFIVRNAITSHGLMPKPLAPATYLCDGYAPPLLLDFRHGQDWLAMHQAGVHSMGTILNGKIVWNPAAPGGQASVTAARPLAVQYDAPTELRILDTAGLAHTCTRSKF